MVFSSVAFLYAFLPALIAVYLLTPRRARNLVLLIGSLTFYVWGAGDFVVVLAGTTLIDFGLGHLIGRARADGRRRAAAWWLTASVLMNVGLLVWFKYANFFAEGANSALGLFGHGDIPHPNVVLPIGISFFVFERMSYSIDVFRGVCPAERNVIDFGLFVALFPRSIAGPIVRYMDIAGQLRHHPTTLDGFSDGVVRFALGLAKKVIVADAAGSVADAAFATNGADLTTGTAWLGVAAYTLQIYFDFSGYSDMAIGLAQIFGFRLPENFNRPYSAVSVTDFWRRWHMTLSSWFRDYLYIPLGGSRRSERRVLANLMIVFLVTGLWHGAEWTFVVWGAYHGALLLIERATGQRALGEDVGFPALRRAVTLLAVMVGWVLFRADGMAEAGRVLKAMFVPDLGPLSSQVVEALNPKVALVMLVAGAVALLPRSFSGPKLVAGTGWRSATARGVLVGLALPYSAILVAAGSFSPFLYFQF